MQIHKPPLGLAFSIILSVLLHYTVPIVQLMSEPYNYFGLILVIIGCLFTFWTKQLLMRHKTTLDPNGFPAQFVHQGPFLFSRNPFYLGYILLAFGASILLGSLTCFIGPTLLFIWLNASVVPREEVHLRTIFGQQYINYQTQVRRWI